MKKLKFWLLLKLLFTKNSDKRILMLTSLLIEESDPMLDNNKGVKCLIIWWDHSCKPNRYISIDGIPDKEFKIETNIKNKNYAGGN